MNPDPCQVQSRVEQLDEHIAALQSQVEVVDEEMKPLLIAEIKGKKTEVNYLQDNYLE